MAFNQRGGRHPGENNRHNVHRGWQQDEEGEGDFQPPALEDIMNVPVQDFDDGHVPMRLDPNLQSMTEAEFLSALHDWADADVHARKATERAIINQTGHFPERTLGWLVELAVGGDTVAVRKAAASVLIGVVFLGGSQIVVAVDPAAAYEEAPALWEVSFQAFFGSPPGHSPHDGFPVTRCPCPAQFAVHASPARLTCTFAPARRRMTPSRPITPRPAPPHPPPPALVCP